jgi:hypothetical protein
MQRAINALLPNATQQQISTVQNAINQQAGQQSTLIKIFSVLGGMLITGFSVAFLFAAGLYNSTIGLVITGILFYGVSMFVVKKANSLVVSAIGTSLFVVAFIFLQIGVDASCSNSTIMLMYALLALISLILLQDFLITFAATILCFGALFFLINETNSHFLICTYVGVLALLITFFFLNEARLITTNSKIAKAYQPFCIGLIIVYLIALQLLYTQPNYNKYTKFFWLTSAFNTLAIYWLATNVGAQLKIGYNKITYAIAVAILIGATIYLPGINGALLIMLLGFKNNYKTGFVLGAAALLYFISRFYYLAAYTLLVKSGLLFFTGVVFLIAFFIVNKKLKNNA